MIEEPYRWVEAIATRRDYIEMQLATGSPVVAVGYAGGILLFTVGQQKLFEIYNRIALGAIGHPGDIERLRMADPLAIPDGFYSDMVFGTEGLGPSAPYQEKP